MTHAIIVFLVVILLHKTDWEGFIIEHVIFRGEGWSPMKNIHTAGSFCVFSTSNEFINAGDE